ncbi:uncharacterized protein LOC125372733 [Haliotis rufescens]|uniref:uncharacterized protein LOC125372733 n=1 Tax=Haliotis rufescens TaxID=6454 RepID=UPI00201F25AC|nr:uncharacterized protein LOC125372733 [Haliotis rufescens]
MGIRPSSVPMGLAPTNGFYHGSKLSVGVGMIKRNSTLGASTLPLSPLIVTSIRINHVNTKITLIYYSGSLRVTADFFENKKSEVCSYIKRWGQGRGERHNWFVTKYPYHEVKAGFGSDFVSAEMYGHILQWLGQSLTRRLVRDKRRPYTKPVTQIFTVPELPMEYTQAAWHCIGMWPLRK